MVVNHKQLSEDTYVSRTTKEIVHHAFLIVEAAQRYKYHHEFCQLILIGQCLYAITQLLVGLRRRDAQK